MNEALLEEAARWLAAQADEDMDWDGFTRWLEADPAHRRALDAVALLDARIDSLLPLVAQRIEAPRSTASSHHIGWGRWAGGGLAIAAAAVGAITLSTGMPDAPAIITYRAPAGQGRTIALADGSSVALAPGSILKAGDRAAPMDLAGSAVFTVRHDADAPLTVRAGGYEIRDMGTRFEVKTAPGILRVAVSEGQVSVRAPKAAAAVAVDAGTALIGWREGARVEKARLRAAGIAAGRGGALVYDDMPLGLVAADIARYVGAPVVVEDRLASRRFSGVIAPGTRAAMVAALAGLTGLDARRDGDTMVLRSGAGA